MTQAAVKVVKEGEGLIVASQKSQQHIVLLLFCVFTTTYASSVKGVA